ncbi:MAG: heme-binding protein, partial [Actinomycetes bacterium]
KAFTAVAHRAATHELAPLAVPGGPLQGLSSNGAGRYVLFAGGLPLWDAPLSEGGRVVGGIGVSGAEAHQDLECAQAAAAPFHAEQAR